jgi:16S rRNA (guanine(966)-N(2))-methyltransferase RsmD
VILYSIFYNITILIIIIIVLYDFSFIHSYFSIISVKRIRPQGATRDREINNPNRLKIIGGTVKGTKLQSPDVYLRPMMAKVREALFSTLGFMDVFAGESTRVLDMFSGSGSVGLEALSRGAVHTTFVDLSKDCTECSLQNAEKCGFKEKVTAVCARAEEVLQNPTKFGLNQPYNLISITPPYLEVSYDELIHSVSHSPLVKEDTIVILEYPTEMGNLPHILEKDRLYGIRNRRYGRTILGIYVFRPSQIYDMKIDEFASSNSNN